MNPELTTTGDRTKRRDFIVKCCTGAALALVSFLVAMQSYLDVFTHSESLLAKGFLKDSSVFRYIGWEMSTGSVPYADSFDHKGPLLYFINLMGTLIDRIQGIWFIEFAFLLATAVLIYKMARRTLGRPYSLFVVLLSMALLSLYYDLGNLSEEYAMPFEIAALYIFLDFFSSPEQYVKATEGHHFLCRGNTWFNMGFFLCGLCFACVFLLRANMISVWLVFCVTVIIHCVRGRAYLELWRFILSFVLGAAALIYPTLIYLGAHDALGAFVDAYLQFNLKYTAHRDTINRVDSFFYFFNTFPLLLSLLVMFARIAHDRKKKESSTILLFDCAYIVYIVLTILLTAMGGHKYKHYGMVLCPAFSYPFCLMCSMLTHKWPRKAKVDLVVVAYLTIAFLIPNWLPTVQGAVTDICSGLDQGSAEPVSNEIVSYISEHTEPDDTITIFGNNDNYYLYSGRRSTSRFSYQFPIGNVDPEILDAYFEDLVTQQPEIVVVEATGNKRMAAFLEEYDYECVIEGEDTLVYQKQ